MPIQEIYPAEIFDPEIKGVRTERGWYVQVPKITQDFGDLG